MQTDLITVTFYQSDYTLRMVISLKLLFRGPIVILIQASSELDYGCLRSCFPPDPIIFV